jgi:hypothetical protein
MSDIIKDVIDILVNLFMISDLRNFLVLDIFDYVTIHIVRKEVKP